MKSISYAGVSVDLSYIVDGLDDDGDPIWRGPVVFRVDGSVFVDEWFGEHLAQTELLDVDDATFAALEDEIARECDLRGSPRGYREPMTCDEVRKIVAVVEEGMRVAA